ncbi:MAG: hypothetical protein SF069_03045 [Phycisphaerae bacterium]|nr:hypothetical protein [Phycisphaerae bacterium]
MNRKAENKRSVIVTIRFDGELWSKIEKRLAKSGFQVNRSATFRDLIVKQLRISDGGSDRTKAASVA